jgi:hypothetical protein
VIEPSLPPVGLHGALAVLGANVGLVLLAGTATLALQRRHRAR